MKSGSDFDGSEGSDLKHGDDETKALLLEECGNCDFDGSDMRDGEDDLKDGVKRFVNLSGEGGQGLLLLDVTPLTLGLSEKLDDEEDFDGSEGSDLKVTNCDAIVNSDIDGSVEDGVKCDKEDHFEDGEKCEGRDGVEGGEMKDSDWEECDAMVRRPEELRNLKIKWHVKEIANAFVHMQVCEEVLEFESDEDEDIVDGTIEYFLETEKDLYEELVGSWWENERGKRKANAGARQGR